MEFIMRKIKELPGTQESTNRVLGNSYTVYFKNTPKEERGKGQFETMLNQYFSDPQPENVVDKTHLVIGFVMGQDGKIIPFWEEDAVYIINENGKTVERVYGYAEKKRQDW